MTTSTDGLRLNRGSLALNRAVELLSSMRFAISLLTVICIATIIGTILKQGEPLSNYVNQFGPFWAEVFARLNLPTVYSAWWFLLILLFLVTSTSLCIARNAPKILIDLKTYKENIREQSLKAFGLKAEGSLALPPEAAAAHISQVLIQKGWKVKLQQRETPTGKGWMLAAKAGAANKLGYLAAHSAIVLVCLGGLLDGNLMIRAQMLFGGKTAYSGGGMIADVKAEHRLPASNPTFRANLLVPEGQQGSVAVINQPSGVLLQELPFSIELKKFIVEHYSTGMPKLFASDIVIHDKETGQAIPARVEVNHPASYQGVEIYQSSFEDGGSAVNLHAVPLIGTTPGFDIKGSIGESSALTNGQDKMTVEYTGLRVINVENMSGNASGTDVRKVDLRSSLESIDQRLGSANNASTKKDLRNVGPSISYKLRDAAGQAREYNNYMLPISDGEDNLPVFLLGVRETPSDPFRYLRIPVDNQGGLSGFTQFRAALADPAMRQQAVNRYVAQALPPGKPELAQQLNVSAMRAVNLFAGAEKVAASNAQGNVTTSGGLQSIGNFIEKNVPETERLKAGEVLVRILNGTLFELMQLSREKAGQKPLPQDDKTQAYMAQTIVAASDSFLYPAPMAFMLSSFKQVQASVFQVTRAPGHYIVYLGCMLLILGVFAMLYVRERRLWIWLVPQPKGTGSHLLTHATMALSSNRKTMDGDREFATLSNQLLSNPI